MSKYLVADTAASLEFVAWAGSLSHAEMLAGLQAMRPTERVRARSAGSMRLATSGDLICEGESQSLKISAHPHDSRLANNLFRLE